MKGAIVESVKPDLDSAENIKSFIDLFYQKVLADDLLATIFLDVALIDLAVHIPIICSYWEKLLLGDKQYQRHTMNIHRRLGAKTALKKRHFDRWLSLYICTAEENFSGLKTTQAKNIATNISDNMRRSIENI